MARRVFDDAKDDQDADGAASARPSRRSPLVKGGAAAPKYIQGSTRTATERTHEDIPVDQIQDSLIEDRIDVTEGLDELVDSIRKNGQQIPIIVRIVNANQPYEIVAGRRRLTAIRQLGHKTIRGFITRMSDKEAFVAQGIENSARLETSFIERSRTAAKAMDAGFEQGDVSEFLGISQTLISFMVRIFTWLGDDLVVTIGPARGIGRRKWEKLINSAKSRAIEPNDLVSLVDTSISDSVDRFEALLAAVEEGDSSSRTTSPPAPSASQDLLGGQYAATRKSRQLVIKAAPKAPEGFLDYLSDRLPELVAEYEGTTKKGT